jgi:integrase
MQPNSNSQSRTRHSAELAQSYSFEEVILLFLQHAKIHKRSYANDLCRTRTLRRHFADYDLSRLTSVQISGYAAQRLAAGMSHATINRELMLLSAAISHAKKTQGWELPNPIRPCLLTEPPGRVRWLSKSDAQRLIAVARQQPKAPYLADFVVLALHTGCRSGELLNLEWPRVDLARSILLLEAQHTKTAQRRTVPLNSHALSALQSRLAWRDAHYPASAHVFLSRSGQPILSIKKSFASALAAAGISDFRIHDLRHTCAAWLVTAGVPLIVVRDLLGHASITITEIYAHLAPDNVRQALSLLDA